MPYDPDEIIVRPLAVILIKLHALNPEPEHTMSGSNATNALGNAVTSAIPILGTIDAAINLVTVGANLVNKLIEDGKQSGQLTDQQVADYKAKAAQAFASPAWDPAANA